MYSRLREQASLLQGIEVWRGFLYPSTELSPWPFTLLQIPIPIVCSRLLCMLIASLIFLLTITLVIWQPKGLGVGWSAVFGAILALLFGVVHLSDIPLVWQIIWNATGTFVALIISSDGRLMLGSVISSATAGAVPMPRVIMVCTIGISAAVGITNSVPMIASGTSHSRLLAMAPSMCGNTQTRTAPSTSTARM